MEDWNKLGEHEIYGGTYVLHEHRLFAAMRMCQKGDDITGIVTLASTLKTIKNNKSKTNRHLVMFINADGNLEDYTFYDANKLKILENSHGNELFKKMTFEEYKEFRPHVWYDLNELFEKYKLLIE